VATTFISLVTPLTSVGQEHKRYTLIDLGSLGGPNSVPAGFSGAGAEVVNNSGTVAGCAETMAPDVDYPNFNPNFQFGPDPNIVHAFQWRNGARIDLGAFPGNNSSCAGWISESGLIAGASETGGVDPLTSYPEAHAALWDHGGITDLKTLGGFESFAYGLNKAGQVVGGATNAIPDPFFGFGTQLRAFVWRDGVMHDLGTLGGPDAFATTINDRGQISGCSLTPLPDTTGAPFLWDNGKMINLGTFGGTNGCAFLVNDAGQVIGGSNLPGDRVAHGFFWQNGVFTDLGNFGGDVVEPFWVNNTGQVVGTAEYPGDVIRHAFLWQSGTMSDLGTVNPQCTAPVRGSVADYINSEGQIVGNSWCGDTATGFLWEKGGPMVDLNTLIPDDSPLQVLGALNINDRGEIVGLGFQPNTGDVHAFLMVPCGNDSSACGGQTHDAVISNSPIVIGNVRAYMEQLRRMRHRFPAMKMSTH
jgi:probable HAF family extracellular repeat protein